MVTTLAHRAEIQGREAELQQELEALRQRASMTQKSILDYVSMTAPKEAAAEKLHADTVRFACELADETDGLAERVGELQDENLSQNERLLVLREDKATALELVNKLEAVVQEKSEELEQAVAELGPAQASIKQLRGQLKSVHQQQSASKDQIEQLKTARDDKVRELEVAAEVQRQMSEQNREARRKQKAVQEAAAAQREQAAAALEAERQESFEAKNAVLDEIAELKRANEESLQKLKTQGEKLEAQQQKNKELADRSRKAEADSRNTKEAMATQHFRLQALKEEAAAQTLKVTALTDEVSKRDEEIQSLREAAGADDSGGGDPPPGDSDEAGDEGEGGKASAAIQVSEDELGVILNVYLYSSGLPDEEQQHAHVLQAAVLDPTSGAVEPRPLTFVGPPYAEVKTMQVANVTEMARCLTLDTLTNKGVDDEIIADSVLHPAQWETAAVRRLAGGEHVYEVFCCVEPDAMDEISATEVDTEHTFMCLAVIDNEHVATVLDGVEPEGLDGLSASHFLAPTTELIMKAHAARRAFFGNADGWEIIWDEIGDRKFSARRLQRGKGESCCVAMRFGKPGHEARHEDISAARDAGTIGVGAVFDAVRHATTPIGMVTAPMETINVSAIANALSPGLRSPATPAKEPEPEPDNGAAAAATELGEGEVQKSGSDRGDDEIKEDTDSKIETSATGSMDWLIVALGSGTTADQAVRLEALEKRGQLEMMYKVDFLNQEMCLKTPTAAQRSGSILMEKGRLKKIWRKRVIASQKGISERIKKYEQSGHVISKLEQIWTLDEPPYKFFCEPDSKGKPKNLSHLKEAQTLLPLILKCADKKNAEILAAEEKVKKAVDTARENSGGSLAKATVKIASRLSAMGIDDDTIAEITEAAADDNGELDTSITEAAAEVLYAERDDDHESVHSHRSGSSSSSSPRHETGDTSGSGDRFRMNRSKTTENNLSAMKKRMKGTSRTEQKRLTVEALRDLPIAKKQGGKFTLSGTQDTEALLHRVEIEYRNRDVLGINHPDKGIDTEVGTIGKVEATTEELWNAMSLTDRYDGERTKIDILLEVLADYNSAEAAKDGEYASICNPTQVVRQMLTDHADQNEDDVNAEPLLFERVRAVLEQRFEYNNRLYNHHCTLVETKIDRLNLENLRRNMAAAIRAAEEADEEKAAVYLVSPKFKTVSETFSPKLVQYVKGVAKFLEQRLKGFLSSAGRDQEEKYKNWSIVEELERIWMALLDKNRDSVKTSSSTRETLIEFEARFKDTQAGAKTRFRWDAVHLLEGLRDKHEADTPISPLEMLDWVSKRANEAMEEWVGDSILQQNLVTDTFDLGKWNPVPGHGENPFVRNDKSFARLRHLVPATVTIVGTGSSESRETLSLMPERPKRDCDPDGIEPGQLGYGLHLSDKKLTALKEAEKKKKTEAAAKKRAKDAEMKRQRQAGGVNAVNGGAAPTRQAGGGAARESLNDEQRVLNIKMLRACVKQVMEDARVPGTEQGKMRQLLEHSVALVRLAADSPAQATKHLELAEAFRRIARDKSSPALEGFLKSLSKPNAEQKTRNRKWFGCDEIPRGNVEQLRTFGCVGCGSMQHLYLNHKSGRRCTNAACAKQKAYWDAREATPTPNVSAESTPPNSGLYRKFVGQRRDRMRATAEQTRKGQQSVFAVNEAVGLKVGDDATGINGVNSVVSNAINAPDDEATGVACQKLFNERGIDVDSERGQATIVALIDLGVDEQAAATIGCEYGPQDAVGAVGDASQAGFQVTADGCTVYRDANGTESTLTKINAEVDPVFTPPASPHGSDEEDDGVNLEDEDTKAQRSAGTTPTASPFPARPPGYVPRAPTFDRKRNGIVPTATITCAENGCQAIGCCDTGAVMCVMNTARAIEWDLMPWDGARTATAANGGSMAVHGVANGVEVYMDGHRLVVDFLIADLGGRFDFLLGYDFMRHYRAHVVPETGQLRGTDADGDKFISKSNYSYTRVLDSIGTDEDAGEVATNALMEGVKAQLAHELSGERRDELCEVLDECTQQLKEATITTHRALCQSKHGTIKAKMAGEWASNTGDEARDRAGELAMVRDVLVCDEINQLDDAVDAAKRILHRAAIAAHHAHKMVEEHDERVKARQPSETAAPVMLVQERDTADGWAEHALNIASEFGDILKTAATAGFQQARSAVKQTTTSLLQLLL